MGEVLSKGKIDGEFDSNEELYFSWYLEELRENGFIRAWAKNNEAFTLTDPYVHEYVVPMKRVSDKVKDQIILRGSEYTHDFDIAFHKSAMGLFVSRIGYDEGKLKTPFLINSETQGLTHVEIKGGFDQNNMTRLVVSNIKFLYHTRSIYVNLIKIPDLFKNTFTPKRYLLTDKSMQQRKIKFKIKSLQEYLKEISNH